MCSLGFGIQGSGFPAAELRCFYDSNYPLIKEDALKPIKGPIII